MLFTGNTAFSNEVLRQVTGNLHDQEISLAELKAAADEITRYYRDHGYLVARAYIPRQRVENGEITIAVMEGILSSVKTNNHSRVSDRQVNGILDHHLATGEPLQSTDANRALLLLQDLPGVGGVEGSLHPGDSVGSTALDVDLTPAARVNGHLGVDNYGSRYTGHYRLTGALDLPNLVGIGDQLGLQGAISQHDGLDYGRLSWDAPVAYDGVRAGVAVSNTNYELGKEFSVLDAHGTATTAALYGSYPILLAPDHHLSLSASLEHRKLKDVTDALNWDARKHIYAAVITLGGDYHDNLLGGGANAWRLSNTVGKLTLDNDDAKLGDQQADTAGSYDKVLLSVTRLQRLPWRFSLYLTGSVQWASKNLDSSEKFFLGGANGVRAYPQGEASGDEGWLVTAELRYRVMTGLRVKVFHDEGGVTINRHDYQPDSNHRHLAGTGIGLDAFWHRLTLGATVAWRNTGKPLSDEDENPRFWFRTAYHF